MWKKIFYSPLNYMIVISTLLFWFLPWVWVLKTKILFYFPYDPQGSRSLSFTGPLPHYFNMGLPWTPKIPSVCSAALVAAEDSRFYDHFGLDLEAIQSSLIRNEKLSKKKNKKIYGGSTITQQLVKNAFLSRDQTLVRKSREAVGALMLNAIMSKDDQILWYFNIVEFGPDIYGIHNASQFYFRKNPEKLNAVECISLVSVLPSPNKWNSSLIKKSESSFFKKRAKVILQRTNIMGHVAKKDLKTAFEKWGGMSSVAQDLSKELPDLPFSDLDRSSDSELPDQSESSPASEIPLENRDVLEELPSEPPPTPDTEDSTDTDDNNEDQQPQP